MTISMFPAYLMRRKDDGTIRGIDESMRLLAEAGFKVFDYTPNIWADGWKAEADLAMNTAAKYGAVIEQSHAPYNFYSKAPREEFMRALDRSAQAAAYMGIRNLVFHADEYHPTPEEPFDADKAREQIYEILSPCIEATLAGGVNVAIETVFEDVTGRPKEGQRMHFCADMDELISIIDKFNDERVGCCWDFGHAKIACGGGDEKHADAIRRMGKRIICTHVHDNISYYKRDVHVPPFMGDSNWHVLMSALRDTGYTGSLTFEMVYGTLPDAAVRPYLDMLYNMGLALERMFNDLTI